jgi:hypothetical protein
VPDLAAAQLPLQIDAVQSDAFSSMLKTRLTRIALDARL